MLDLWFTTMMLLAESHDVVGLRMTKMFLGGPGALEEAHLMVSEKMDAAVEAGTALMIGGDALDMVARYREHVAANLSRLAAA